MDIQLARNLVNLFYPLVELTLFDKAGTIQEIFNAFSGLKEDQQCDVKNSGDIFTEQLVVGRNVRCLIYPIRNDNEQIGYLRLRYDLTYFKSLQEQLSFLLQADHVALTPKVLDQWKESIDQMIMDFLAVNKIIIQALNAKQKRELITKLQEKGLLDFKESSSYIASKLQVSRATVYNYLKTASDFKKIHVHQVDAFTSEKFGGNPAGVVLDADALDETMMRKIARELNLSETAFVLTSKQGAFQLRYFTPTGHEISFCGHSTVGALYMIAKEKRFGMSKSGDYAFDVETLCGILKMQVAIDKDEEIQVSYETPTIKLNQSTLSHLSIARAAGIEPSLIDPSFPVMYEETNKDLFIVIRSLEDLKKIDCDSKSLAQFSKQHDIVALCLLCPDAIDRSNQFHMRCYAPLVGISEDPFTGSVLGGLTAYVDMFGLLPKGSHSFRVEQGHLMGRPGVVEVQFLKKRGAYHAKVFAHAVHCFSTEINL